VPRTANDTLDPGGTADGGSDTGIRCLDSSGADVPRTVDPTAGSVAAVTVLSAQPSAAGCTS